MVRRHAHPTGTTFILSRGTIDEVMWKGSTERIAVAIHPNLLVNALDETVHQRDIELAEHWNLMDPNIMALLLALRTDLDEGSPAGRLYAESLANAETAVKLAVLPQGLRGAVRIRVV